MSKISVYVVDHLEVVRLGVACVLYNTQDLEACGQATRSEDVFAFLFNRASVVADHLPDVIVTELSLPGMNGIEMISDIVAMYEDRTSILVHTGLSRELYEERAFRAGAKGFVRKGPTVEPLVASIRVVASGKYAFSEALNAHIFQRARSGAVHKKSGVDLLSDRELQVFRCIGSGLTTTEIADRSHLSRKTVETHRENIKHKLNLCNAIQLMRAATAHMIREEDCF